MSIDINSIKRDLVNRYPFFGSIIDSLDYVETKNCIGPNGNPTAGTNGNTIYYHPDFISGLNDKQKTFVFAHEICHVAFNHMNRGKDKNQKVWNVATDAVINAFLKKDGLEFVDGVVDIPWAIKYDAEEMYKKLMKKQNKKKKQNQQNDQNQSNPNDVGHDTHTFWDEDFEKQNDEAIKKMQEEFEKLGEKETLKPKEKEEIKDMLKKMKKALEEIKKQKKTVQIKKVNTAGNSTSEETIKFDDVGTSYPLINWPLILKRPTEITELDWSYQNSYVEDGVVLANLEESSYLKFHDTEIVLDTSGSVKDELLRSFLRECKNILNYSRIKVGCFDTKFYGFHEIKSIRDVDNFTFVGRGGTNFDVAVNAFSEKADNKIIFTDGDAWMPSKKVDAVWVIFGGKKINPNGGKVIYVDEKMLMNSEKNNTPVSLVKRRIK